ncbi:pentatricopeptide repeat-containing protein At2g20710, mitochondrial-like [Bidens hawaiensis]|uniref:pentatricopeptide repeat-containing protein At2g20710, mitochondrial-like n=1 Tax=Bidens hawaiensis TaxID=980011 RepID=UPI00404ABCC5
MNHFCRLKLRTPGVCGNALKSSFSTKLPSQTAAATERKNKNPSHDSSLYRRISPVGDPDLSILPVLDLWVTEGRKVDKDSLDKIIKSLINFKRFKHALEISEWMTDKRYMPPTKGDIRERLHLIYKVHGLQKAEEFYNNISQVLKGFIVDVCLLNIYSLEKLVDKAEAMFQKLCEKGRVRTPLPFNILLNLYYNVGNWEKMDALIKEMEKAGLYPDKYSLTPRLNAYAETGNIEGLNKIMEIMEADPRVGVDCETYLIAANAFLKAGLGEKSLGLLKMVEKMAMTKKGWYKILSNVLRTYAKLGKKDEVERIWNILKKDKVYNVGYRNMINALLKFDDVEGAVKIFKEWEMTGLSYDFRVVDDLIDVYVKNGQLVKAEAVLNSGIEKEGTPSFHTWYGLMIGYVEDGQVLKGVVALKNAVLSCRLLPSEEPVKDKLAIVLECLERKYNAVGNEEIEGFMKSLVVEGVFSPNVCARLVDFGANRCW